MLHDMLPPVDLDFDIDTFTADYPEIEVDASMQTHVAMVRDEPREHPASRLAVESLKTWAEDVIRARSRQRWIAENPEAYAIEQAMLLAHKPV